LYVSITLRTKSKKCLTLDFYVGFQLWLPKWQQNGFRTATGVHIKNVGIIRYLSAHLDARSSYGQQIYLHYVKGHNGEEGNKGADAQANKGTMFPAVPERDWEKLELELREQIEAGQLRSANQPNVAIVKCIIHHLPILLIFFFLSLVFTLIIWDCIPIQ
jgi:hypothetical protein